MSNQLDSFDVILEYLVKSGFPEQEALVIMAEMSDEKREQILSEMDYKAPPKPVPTAPIERKAKQPETRKAPSVDVVKPGNPNLDQRNQNKKIPKNTRTVLSGTASAIRKMRAGKKSDSSGGPGVTLPAVAGVTAAKGVEAAIEMSKKKKDKKKGPPPVISGIGEGVLDAALEGDKKMGELHKKVDNDVKRMKDGKKFKEEVEIEEGTGAHREADTGKVVDKPEIGKTYYPNQPKIKSSVALRKEKERQKTAKEEIDSLRDAYNSVFAERAELSIQDQMRISREAAKNRNPNPDHRAIRAKQMKNSTAPKDTRTDAEKMTDATGPRKGSNYRGD